MQRGFEGEVSVFTSELCLHVNDWHKKTQSRSKQFAGIVTSDLGNRDVILVCQQRKRCCDPSRMYLGIVLYWISPKDAPNPKTRNKSPTKTVYYTHNTKEALVLMLSAGLCWIFVYTRRLRAAYWCVVLIVRALKGIFETIAVVQRQWAVMDSWSLLLIRSFEVCVCFW